MNSEQNTNEVAGGGSALNVELDITLRDYFAANALQGLLTMPDEWSGYFSKDGCGSTWKAEAAKAAYSLADEMIQARMPNAELTGVAKRSPS